MYLIHFLPFVHGGARWHLILAVLILAPAGSALTIEAVPNMVVSDLVAGPGDSIIIHGTGPLTIAGTLQAGHGAAGQDGGDIIIDIDGPLLLKDGARLIAGDGGDGATRIGRATIHGQDGGGGGSITVHAAVHGTLYVGPGDGGDGGNAFVTGHPATAVGGHGGDAGRMEAPVPAVLLAAARGGDGGHAEARGDACTGRPGRDAYVRTQNETTGDARHAEARGEAGACSPPGEDGAPGGNATAIGGDGGYTENGPGGRGGNATAIGGRGGDALDLCYASTEAAEASGYTKAGDGGVGGTPTAIGGNGGTGLNGGRGGDAYTESHGSNGGNATMPILAGTGGTNQGPGGMLKGGDGGFGIVNGGPGGSAIGRGFSGDSGSHCGPLPYRGIPSAPTMMVGLSLLGAVVARRTWK